MGSYAPASFPHMMAEQMNKDHGLKIDTVHYKGESPMWLDIASGATQVAVGSYQAFATVVGRGVRPIGVTNQLRIPKLPDVPTLVEQGNKSELVNLVGGLPMTVPAGTPEDIIRKLAAVAVEGSEAPKYKALRDSFAIPDKVVGLEETRRIWREVAPKWISQAEALGVKLD
jgi:tripartite-type tricarboxylate transporter receptor subunit TctC